MSESGMESLGIFEISPHTTLASLHSRNVSHASMLKSFAHIVLNPARSIPKSNPPAPQNKLTAVNVFFFFAIQPGRAETHPLQIRARDIAGHHAQCTKRERIFLSMHSTEARPKAHLEYTEKENAPLSGASPLTCRSRFNIGRISVERLVSVDAKLSSSLRLSTAAVAGRPPYRFRSRGTHDPTIAATTAAQPPMTVSLLYWLCPFIFGFTTQIGFMPLRDDADDEACTP